MKKPHPAIFTSPKAVFHADTCDLLAQAADRGEVRLVAWGRRGYPGRPFPPRELTEVPSIGFWDCQHNQDWGLGWHRNEGIELTFLARGKLDFAVDEQNFQIESGHLTITRPWQRHRVGKPLVQASRLHWCILDLGVRRPNERWRWPAWLVLSPKDQHRLTTLLSHNEQSVWQANAAIRNCFEAIASQLDQGSPFAESRLRVCLNLLFVELLQLLESENIPLEANLSSTQRTVELFLASMPHHLDQHWDIDNMARQCGIGRSQFGYYCRQITNRSPAKYVMDCRLQLAQKLLHTESKRSITDIAFDCGFESSQYFANVFRREIGCSPTEFRQHLPPDEALRPLTETQTRPAG